MQATKIDHLVVTSKLSSIDNGISGDIRSNALPQTLQPLFSEQCKETNETPAALTHGLTLHTRLTRLRELPMRSVERVLHLCETLSVHSRDVLESRMLQR